MMIHFSIILFHAPWPKIIPFFQVVRIKLSIKSLLSDAYRLLCPSSPLIYYVILCRVQIMKLLGVCHIVQPAVIYCFLGPNISLGTPFLTPLVGVLPMTRKDFVILATLHWGSEPVIKKQPSEVNDCPALNSSLLSACLYSYTYVISGYYWFIQFFLTI